MGKNVLNLKTGDLDLPHGAAIAMLAVCLQFGPAVAEAASPPESDGRKVIVYEVPTTGKIMDVIYVPDFDEWWVKCQEQGGISIYSFDKKSKKWGQIRFVPATGAIKDKPEPTIKSTQREEPASGVTDGKPGDKKTGQDESVVSPVSGSEHKKPDDDKKRTGEKKKWWDPLNFFKKAD